MKIIIPMSGKGQRFLDKGYRDIKPLIEVDGKPIIEHVVNLFPGEKDILFICSEEHLKNTSLRQTLNRIAPCAKILSIAPHKKGPVYAVLQAADMIADDEEVIVNYCDFSVYWDYKDFLDTIHREKADGCVPAYRGFHPHMLGTTNYAFMRDRDNWMLEIQEKTPFTSDRMQEYASTGTYYFKKGEFLKKYFTELMQKDISLKGEYYVSMVYNLLVQSNLKVFIYEIPYMQQWGTPEELEEYKRWSAYFASLMTAKKPLQACNAIKLIPLAGKGQRFAQEGYTTPKPLIKITGKPMIVQAARALPLCERNIFVCLEEHLKEYPLKQALLEEFPAAKIVSLSETTQGQACTCELGLNGEDHSQPLFIGACDNSLSADYEKLGEILKKYDVLVFTFRNNPAVLKKPEAYGWVKTTQDGQTITEVSVKKPISDNPINDHAVVGGFYFAKAEYFIKSLNYLYQNDIRVNNEFYADSCINAALKLGLSAGVFEVQEYICWGTPNDLKVFEYYQRLFDKLDYHPYSYKQDVKNNE